MHADYRRDVHGPCHDRCVRCLASKLRGKSENMRPVQRCGIGRGQIPRNDDMRFVPRRDGVRSLAEKMLNDTPSDVFDIHHAFAQVGIVDLA